MSSSSRNLTALKIGCALVIGAMFSARASAQATAQAPIKVTLIKADRLSDPRSGRLPSDQGVLVEGEKIKEVGTLAQIRTHAPANAAAKYYGLPSRRIVG